MPPSVVSAVQRLWAAQIKDANGKPLFSVRSSPGHPQRRIKTQPLFSPPQGAEAEHFCRGR
jgi:hypothetical protein